MITHFRCVYFILALYLSIILPNGVIAGEKNPAKINHKPAFAKEEFDVTMEKLPQNYIGHDFASLYDALIKIAPRSEFETSDAYEQRLSALSSKPLIGPLTASSLFAFTVNELKTSYVADSQTLSVTFYGRAGGRDSAVFDLSSSYQKKGSYIGANAFNRKVQVQQGQELKYSVQFPNCKHKYNHGGRQEYDSIIVNQSLETSFIIDPDSAKKSKNTIALLIIGKLRLPFAESKHYRSEPKIDYPYDITTDERKIYLDVSAMWLYDKSSGTLYKKIEKCTQGASSPGSKMVHYLF
jgi:hypothetical protein